MKGMIVTLSLAAVLALTSCMNNNPAAQEKKATVGTVVASVIVVGVTVAAIAGIRIWGKGEEI